jgi:hypothetical protein
MNQRIGIGLGIFGLLAGITQSATPLDAPLNERGGTPTWIAPFDQ